MITVKRKARQALAHGILIRVCNNNMSLFQFVIPPNCIFMTKETINGDKVILPVVYLTQNYEPIKDFINDKTCT